MTTTVFQILPLRKLLDIVADGQGVDAVAASEEILNRFKEIHGIEITVYICTRHEAEIARIREIPGICPDCGLPLVPATLCKADDAMKTLVRTHDYCPQHLIWFFKGKSCPACNTNYRQYVDKKSIGSV